MNDTVDAFDPPFEILEPREIAAPFVFNSPHSGRHYPPSFLAASRLDPLTLRRSEDTFVDELFSCALKVGAPLMRAHFPRSYLDVNREAYELDPRMFADPLPDFANTRSLRVAGGLGTIARIVADSHEIYAEPLPLSTALGRIDRLYRPYHATLRSLVEGMRARFGVCVLIDCHSMPSARRAGEREPRPDFVLGDRYGTSCVGMIADVASRSLRDMGYSVARNKPYAGGYITEHYGRPSLGLHALQIEINRALYMDELRYAKSTGFAPLERALSKLVQQLVALPFQARPAAEAAE